MDDLFDDFGFTNAHRDEDEYQPEVQDDEEPQQSLNTAFKNDEGSSLPNPNKNIDDALADVATAPKSGTRRQGTRKPLLDPAKLCGMDGVEQLLDMFDGIKFKGKGHETEDLNAMMAKLEYWAHCLCPRLPFDNVLEKLEILGSKRPVQVALNRIRTGEADPVEEDGDGEGDVGNDLVIPPSILDSSGNLGIGLIQHPTQMDSRKMELTEEQRRRLEENKRRAQERRLAKQNQASQMDDDFDDILGSLGPGFDIPVSQPKAISTEPKTVKPIQYVDDIDFMEEENNYEDEEAWMALAP